MKRFSYKRRLPAKISRPPSIHQVFPPLQHLTIQGRVKTVRLHPCSGMCQCVRLAVAVLVVVMLW